MNDTPIKQSVWMAKSNFNFAKNNKATVRIAKVVHLASNAVLKIMSQTFEPLSRDAHYITVAARIILADRVSGKIYQEDGIFGAETKVIEHMARINEYFDRRIQQAEQKIEMMGGSPSELVQRTQAYEAECTTRTATEYLQILKKADIYLGMLEYLWIMQGLSTDPLESVQAKLNSEKEVKQHILSIPRKSTSQFQIIHKICRDVMAQRKSESLAQSERDKKKHEMKQRQNVNVAVAQAELSTASEIDDDTVYAETPPPAKSATRKNGKSADQA